MKPICVLYPVNADFPSSQAGAIQVVHTARALAALGCRVYLLLRRASLQSALPALRFYDLTPHPNLRVVQIPVIRLPGAGLSEKISNFSFYPLCMLISFFLVLLGKVDIIYVRLETRRVYWFFRMLRDVFKKKLVFEAHQVLFAQLQGGEVAPPVDAAKLKPAARQAYFQERSICETADGIVFITSAMRECARQFHTLKQPTCVIHDASRFASADKPRVNDDKHVVYCGRLAANRGVDILIEAMALTPPDVRLTVVGGSSESRGRSDCGDERRTLEKMVAELGLAERVAFAGPVPPGAVRSYLDKASVLAIPMRADTQTRLSSPLKLFEYMASGKPIVAAALDGVMEILRHEENALLFEPDNPRDLANQLNRLLASKDLQAKLARQALEDAAAHTWEKRADQALRFLRSVICVAA